jgi:hypothetical protein
MKPENFSSSSESKVGRKFFLRRRLLDGSCWVVRLCCPLLPHPRVLSVRCHKKFISSHNDDHKMVNREEICIQMMAKKQKKKLCAGEPCFFDLSSFMVAFSEPFHSINNKACTRRMCVARALVLLHCDSVFRLDSTRGSKYESLIRSKEHFCLPRLPVPSLVVFPATAKQ